MTQHTYKKFLSQNFLIDNNIINKIIKSININNNDTLLEIGPGDGAISKNISTLSKTTLFIELDNDLIETLTDKLEKKNNTIIYNDDILKFNFKDITKKYKKIRIIGNIPYKISTKLLLNLTKFDKNIKDIHLVIQKNISDRLTTQHNKKIYGSTSIIMQYHFTIIKIFDIKPNSFKPIPKVNSTLIKLTPIKKKQTVLNYEIFKNTIKLSFNNRRKKLSKSIENITKFKKYININKRAEQITLNEYVRISNLLAITNND